MDFYKLRNSYFPTIWHTIRNWSEPAELLRGRARGAKGRGGYRPLHISSGCGSTNDQGLVMPQIFVPSTGPGIKFAYMALGSCIGFILSESFCQLLFFFTQIYILCFCLFKVNLELVVFFLQKSCSQGNLIFFETTSFTTSTSSNIILFPFRPVIFVFCIRRNKCLKNSVQCLSKDCDFYQGDCDDII